MRFRILQTAFFLLLTVLYSCNDENSTSLTDYPLVMIDDVSNITAQGAEFNADVLSFGNQEVLDYGFVWDNNNHKPTLYNFYQSVGNKLTKKGIHFNLDHALEKGIKYFVRAYVKTDKNIVYSDVTSFVSQGSNPPVINNITQLYGILGIDLKIEGENFMSSPTKIKVKFGNVTVPVDFATENSIYVKAPQYIALEDVKVSVEIASMVCTYNLNLNLYNPWVQKNNFDLFEYERIVKTTSFVVQNNAYLICDNSNVLYIYNSDTDSWTNNIKLPENTGNYSTSFAINGNGYLLIQNKLWQYDTSNKSWIVKNGFPGTMTYYTYTFCLGNNVYVGEYYKNKKLWQYDPITDSWTEKSSFPDASIYPWRNFSFSVNNRGYFGTNTGTQYQLWEYNPETDKWVRKSDYPVNVNDNFCCFVIGDKVYLGLGSDKEAFFGESTTMIWEYDAIKDTWHRCNNSPKPLSVLTSFTINNKGYVFGFDKYYQYVSTIWIYEFNPTKN